MLRVTAVHPDSLGHELALAPGYELVSVDGRDIEDFLDWEFLTAADRFVLLAHAPDGTAVEYDVERPEGLPMGVEVEPPRIRRCANLCDFCFVDGLPEGLRDALYIRDDDYRLSFRYGNFATLTNLKPKDIRRILEYRLSPLYVSVHATDAIVRRRLLRNPRAPDIVPLLKMFAQGGIRFHAQVVLQPGVNDGPVLVHSLEDLYAMGDAILSVSVVPVGLTEHSKHHKVREATRDECRAAIAVVERFAARAYDARGRYWAYGADELYLRADAPLPGPERYDDFEQVENGVGSVRYLQRQIADAQHALPDLTGTRVAVVTGTAMGGLMPQVLEPLARATGGTFELVIVTNDLFGPTVTSAGLLPGRAIGAALEQHRDCRLALLPAEAVNDDGKFIDDLDVHDLEAASPAELRLSYHFTDALQAGVAV